MNKYFTAATAFLLAVMLTAVPAVPVRAAASVSASAPYATKWTQTSTWVNTIRPALLKTTDADMVYRELKLGFMYQVMTEGDVYELYKTPGVKIPDAALQKLAAEGWISGYLFRTLTGQALTASDMSAVFDPAYYYAANPWLQGVIAPTDTDTLFRNFLTVGMPLGAAGSAQFNPAVYKANYPDLAAQYGDNNANYYIHYILYGKQEGMNAVSRMKKQ